MWSMNGAPIDIPKRRSWLLLRPSLPKELIVRRGAEVSVDSCFLNATTFLFSRTAYPAPALLGDIRASLLSSPPSRVRWKLHDRGLGHRTPQKIMTIAGGADPARRAEIVCVTLWGKLLVLVGYDLSRESHLGLELQGLNFRD